MMSGPLAVHCQPRASADEGLGPCGPLAGASRPEGRGGLCPRSPAVSESPWTPLCPQTRGTGGPCHLPKSLFTVAEEAHEGVWPRAQWASAPETGQERNRTATARVGPSCAPAVRILCGLSRRNPQSRHASPHSQTWKLRPPEVTQSLANGRATCKAQLSWPPRQTKTLRSLRELPFI